MIKITRGDITTYTFNVEVPEELVDSVKRKKVFGQFGEHYIGIDMNINAKWSTIFPNWLFLTIETNLNEQEITEKVTAFVTEEYNRVMKTPLAQL